MITQLIQFVQKNIVCKFGILQLIISDNISQFISKVFQKFCTKYRIRNVYLSPRYPQTNGKAKVTNKNLLGYFKKCLTTAKGKWIDKLPIALWAYRTTLRQPTGETPYVPTFGAEVRIPIEYGLEPLRVSGSVELAHALDELKEKKEWAAIRMTEYQRRAAWQVDQIVKPKAFNKWDLVLRQFFEEGKLKPI